MNAVTKYGNLISGLMEGAATPAPYVGQPATILDGRDRAPGTVIGVTYTKAGKLKAVIVQRDKFERTDNNGMSESQSYKFSRDQNGATKVYTKRRNGRLIEEGESAKYGYSVFLGRRERFYDFSF